MLLGSKANSCRPVKACVRAVALLRIGIASLRGHGEVLRSIPATRNAIATSALTMMCHLMTLIATTMILVCYQMTTMIHIMIEVIETTRDGNDGSRRY